MAVTRAPLAPPTIAEALARLALDRMPACGVVIFLAMFLMLPFGSAFGLELPLWASAPCCVVLAGIATLAVAAYRRRIPLRWAHLAAGALWCTAPALQLFGEYVNHNGMLITSLMVSILCAPCTQFHTRGLIATTLAAALAWVPLGLRDLGPNFPIGALSVFSAVGIAALWHALELRAQRDAKQLRDQLLHAQKMDAIATLAAGVAHDMNNILAGVIGTAEQIAAPEAREDVALVIREAERGAALTRNLLAFSQRGQYRKQVVTLASIVDPIVPLITRTRPRIEIDVQHDPEAAVDGDPAQLGQAVLHLCTNAADAMHGAGKITIASERRDGRVVLRVTDQGEGMTSTVRARMFEPFFTTKLPTGGTGLGLAMVFGTVQAHGGEVEVESAPGRGTTMRLVLPAVPAPVAIRRETPSYAAVPASVPPGKVLVIDDEPLVRNVIQRALRRLGLEVLTADGGTEGVALVRAHADLDLVILDMSMPDLGGPETFVRIRAHAPAMQVMIASGYAIDHEAQDMLANGAVGFLEKPFNAAQLAQAVQPWLRKAPLARTG